MDSGWWWLTKAQDGLFGPRVRRWATWVFSGGLVLGGLVPAFMVWALNSFMAFETHEATQFVQPLLNSILATVQHAAHTGGHP
ncbi:MAG: hypothetical protein ACREOE_02220 [Gemmatimonadales bacterium]